MSTIHRRWYPSLDPHCKCPICGEFYVLCKHNLPVVEKFLADQAEKPTSSLEVEEGKGDQ